uniref:SDR family NAD(P)-dependent oxidoreductase n=1 Tax=Herbaspirillum lusitanum TaxID=213312 RepID=UPI000590547B
SAASAVICDVTSATDVKAAVKHCVDRFGVPDIIVNNAGTTHRNQPMLDVDEATFDRMYAINVKSIYHMTRAVLPLMRERNAQQKDRGGVMLNIGSVAGIRPRPGLTWYNSSKGAVNMLSKSMAVELAPDRIRVAEETGAQAVQMAHDGLTIDKILTPAAFENAMRVLLAIGGSTNGIVHLTAIAGRMGLEIDLDALDRMGRETPVLLDLKPSGKHYMEDFHHAGGMATLLRELKPLLRLEALTVTGRTLGEEIERARAR